MNPISFSSSAGRINVENDLIFSLCNKSAHTGRCNVSCDAWVMGAFNVNRRPFTGVEKAERRPRESSQSGGGAHRGPLITWSRRNRVAAWRSRSSVEHHLTAGKESRRGGGSGSGPSAGLSWNLPVMSSPLLTSACALCLTLSFSLSRSTGTFRPKAN